MRALYRGLRGDDVRAWEYFLIGQNPLSHVIADGYFDDVTYAATRAFQISMGASAKDADGIVGPYTLGKAMGLGFNPLFDGRPDQDGPNWPARPAEGPLAPANREAIFGSFSYTPTPSKTNPESIKITDGWDKKNIVQIAIPQLTKQLKINKISCHKLIAPQMQAMFVEWEKENLLGHLLTWNGSWACRFIRGSRSTLSNHSWGTAFDINVAWNGLGVQPALKGKKGSVRELVEIAYKHGFYWGGWFKNRPDGMHFEAYKVVK